MILAMDHNIFFRKNREASWKPDSSNRKVIESTCATQLEQENFKSCRVAILIMDMRSPEEERSNTHRCHRCMHRDARSMASLLVCRQSERNVHHVVESHERHVAIPARYVWCLMFDAQEMARQLDSYRNRSVKHTYDNLWAETASNFTYNRITFSIHAGEFMFSSFLTFRISFRWFAYTHIHTHIL